jgi:hypothetical protein
MSKPYDTRKKSAQTKVRREVEKGTIPPASECACQECGISKKDNPKVVIEYHHEDYDNPLDIIPLCRTCHWARHAEIDPTYRLASAEVSAERTRKSWITRRKNQE